MKNRLLPFALALLCCLGCGAHIFKWREKAYEFPEMALRDQRAELKLKVSEVPEAIKEDRLGGGAVVIIPTQRGLQATLYGKQPDLEGLNFFNVKLLRNEATALAESLKRAGMFDRFALREAPVPAAEKPAGRQDWVVFASPEPGSKSIAWGLRHKGKTVRVKYQSARSGEARFDAFVEAVGEAGFAAKGEGGGLSSALPLGWKWFILPPGGGASFAKVGFPIVPKQPMSERGSHGRSWSVRGKIAGLELHIYATQAINAIFAPGMNGARRDELRRQNKATILVDEDLPQSTKNRAEKWVLFQRQDSGALIVSRILRSNGWLVAVSAAGPIKAVFKGNRFTKKNLRGQMSQVASAFLDTLKISD